MTDELLPYYQRELTYLRRLGAEFAARHPKIAARLRLGPDEAEDPHVERLIEGFAFLTARIRHKLDDEFPEITHALLNVLYPHYLAPVPSMAVVRFQLDPGQGASPAGYRIERGESVETDPIQGEPCRFRTAYPVILWPLEVAEAQLQGPPFRAPQVSLPGEPAAVLRLRIQAASPQAPMSALRLQRLRFYLHGQAQDIHLLYELLMNNVLGAAVAASPSDPNPLLLPPPAIRPVGFEADEALLPYSARSLRGYCLLTELFAFPQKFFFFDLAGLAPERLAGFREAVEVYVYLSRGSADLERAVGRDTFRLGCSPMVNLFARRAEPIRLDHAASEHRVVPDARRPRAHEVYQVERVTATAPDGRRVEFAPFYACRHRADRSEVRAFWCADRRPAQWTGDEPDYGTEVYLRLVDLAFRPSAPANWTLDVETTCLNRDLPRRLPFGRGEPPLRLAKGGPLAAVECLTRPTPTLRPPLREGAWWRLVSHLSLNHLSLSDSETGAEALREMLRLYNLADSAETRALIEGVLSVRSRRVAGRTVSGGRSGFCRGVEVNLHLDEDRFVGSGPYLLAAVLERFFALYASINSFSQLVVTTTRREGVLRRWPPRAGEQPLL